MPEKNLHHSRLEKIHQDATAWALFFIMVFGLWQLTGALLHHQQMNYPDTWSDFFEGRLTTTLEKQIDKNLPLREEIIAVANGIRYNLTGGANDQVRLGRQGWLFLTEEIRFYENSTAHLVFRADLIASVAHALRARHIHLLVAIIPDKSRIYSEKLIGWQYPKYNDTRYTSALAELGRRNIASVNLLDPLLKISSEHEVYYRTDTHWNQLGAKIAAEQIARIAQALPLGETVHFQTYQASIKQPRQGDLVKLMGIASLPPIWRPQDDLEAAAFTQQISKSTTATDLFGDMQIPVTLLGTSYSLRGNFHGYLQQKLSVPVLNMAKDGGGFLQAASSYFTSEEFHTSPPRLIIWELPERFLYAPLKEELEWQKIHAAAFGQAAKE